MNHVIVNHVAAPLLMILVISTIAVSPIPAKAHTVVAPANCEFWGWSSDETAVALRCSYSCNHEGCTDEVAVHIVKGMSLIKTYPLADYALSLGSNIFAEGMDAGSGDGPVTEQERTQREEIIRNDLRESGFDLAKAQMNSVPFVQKEPVRFVNGMGPDVELNPVGQGLYGVTIVETKPPKRIDRGRIVFAYVNLSMYEGTLPPLHYLFSPSNKSMLLWSGSCTESAMGGCSSDAVVISLTKKNGLTKGSSASKYLSECRPVGYQEETSRLIFRCGQMSQDKSAEQFIFLMFDGNGLVLPSYYLPSLPMPSFHGAVLYRETKDLRGKMISDLSQLDRSNSWAAAERHLRRKGFRLITPKTASDFTWINAKTNKNALEIPIPKFLRPSFGFNSKLIVGLRPGKSERSIAIDLDVFGGTNIDRSEIDSRTGLTLRAAGSTLVAENKIVFSRPRYWWSPPGRRLAVAIRLEGAAEDIILTLDPLARLGLVERLWRRGEPKEIGRTALIDAIASNIAGRKQLVKWLNSDDAAAKVATSWGNTAIHHVVNSNTGGWFVLLLLQRGADINAQNKWGETPLHWAAVLSKLEIAELLIRNGADCEIRDAKGRPPLARAPSPSSVRWQALSKWCGAVDDLQEYGKITKPKFRRHKSGDPTTPLSRVANSFKRLVVIDDDRTIVRFNGGPSAVVQAVTSKDGSVALDLNGKVWAWGHRPFGDEDPGIGDTDASQPVPGIGGVIQITASAALLADGTVATWKWGSLDKPKRLPGFSRIVRIVQNERNIFALREDGRVVAWGDCGWRQLGKVRCEIHKKDPKPVVVSGIRNVVDIAAGWNCGFALLKNGRVVGWGSNAGMQLGVATPKRTIGIPVEVPGVTNAVRIADGFALNSDGTLFCWSGREGAIHIEKNKKFVSLDPDGPVAVDDEGWVYRLEVREKCRAVRGGRLFLRGEPAPMTGLRTGGR